MAAASHAPAPAIRAASVVPRIVTSAAAATVIAGLLIRHFHGGLGTATPPFVMVWGPRLHPLALVSVAAAALAVVLAPRLVAAADRPASFAARVLALCPRARSRAQPRARRARAAGTRSSTCGPAARSRPATSTCPGCRRCPTARASTSTASPSSSRRCRSTSPATRRRRCSCCMPSASRPPPAPPRCASAAAALTAPLTYALGRSLGTDRDARVAAVLAACSPAMLLFGVTSFDAVFAACGLAAAALLAARAARRAGGRRRGARRRQPPLVGAARGRRVGHASSPGAGAVRWPRSASRPRARPRGWSLNGALAAAYGYDPIGTLRATEGVYRHSVASVRPYAFWVIGSPVAWGVMLGLPIAAAALRSLVRREDAAIALAVVVIVAAVGRLHQGRDRAHLAVPGPAGLRGGGAGDQPAARHRGDRRTRDPGARGRGALRHHLVIVTRRARVGSGCVAPKAADGATALGSHWPGARVVSRPR